MTAAASRSTTETMPRYPRAGSTTGDTAGLQAGDPLAPPHEQRAEGEDGERHPEGRLEAVPEREVVLLGAGEAVGVGGE